MKEPPKLESIEQFLFQVPPYSVYSIPKDEDKKLLRAFTAVATAYYALMVTAHIAIEKALSPFEASQSPAEIHGMILNLASLTIKCQ